MENEENVMRQDKCEFCDGLIQSTVTRVPFHYKGSTVYVDNVPVRMCNKCGEIYFEAKVYKRLERIAENKRKIRARISFPLADYRLA